MGGRGAGGEFTRYTAKAFVHACARDIVLILRPLPVLPPSPYLLYMGWVSVGWQRYCKTCRSLCGLDNQGAVLFFAVGHSWRAHLCGVENLHSAQRELSYHVVFVARHPRGSHIVPSLLSLELATLENKLTH